MYIGIDWGGTKMEVIGLDAQGIELCRHRIPTPREDYDASIRAVLELVAHVETTTGAPFVLAGQGTAYTADGAPLHPVGPGRWKLGEDELVFRAEGGFDRLTTDGQRVFYRPQAPSTLTAADMADYQGLYVSDEAQGRWRIATAGDGLTVAIGVWPSKPLRPVYGEVFSGEDGTVSFERDLTGKVVALSVNNGRAMHVRFARQGD